MSDGMSSGRLREVYHGWNVWWERSISVWVGAGNRKWPSHNKDAFARPSLIRCQLDELSLRNVCVNTRREYRRDWKIKRGIHGIKFKMCYLSWKVCGRSKERRWGRKQGNKRRSGGMSAVPTWRQSSSTVCCEFPVREVSTLWSVGHGSWR